MKRKIFLEGIFQNLRRVTTRTTRRTRRRQDVLRSRRFGPRSRVTGRRWSTWRTRAGRWRAGHPSKKSRSSASPTSGRDSPFTHGSPVSLPRGTTPSATSCRSSPSWIRSRRSRRGRGWATVGRSCAPGGRRWPSRPRATRTECHGISRAEGPGPHRGPALPDRGTDLDGHDGSRRDGPADAARARRGGRVFRDASPVRGWAPRRSRPQRTRWPWEILCGVGPRVPRIILEGGRDGGAGVEVPVNSCSRRSGAAVLRLLEGVGRFFELLGQTLRGLVMPPYQISMTAKQIVRVGVDSVPVVFLTALFTGGVLALQTFKGFQRFHAEGYIGSVVALSMLRELGARPDGPHGDGPRGKRDGGRAGLDARHGADRRARLTRDRPGPVPLRAARPRRGHRRPDARRPRGRDRHPRRVSRRRPVSRRESRSST